MLAKRLLVKQIDDPANVERILEFLCSESGSHDYSIYRNEAKEDLGLRIDKPDVAQYSDIKALYDDVAADLELGIPFSPDVILGADARKDYSLRRALIESAAAGSDSFVSEGELIRRQVQVAPGVMQSAVEDHRTFEGWRRESA